MTIWALSDLHLSLSVPAKTMEVFGPDWIGYHEKIEKHWRNTVGADDLVLVPGDISWAMTLEQAATDLSFIDALPGQKLIIKGNHDYWWDSSSKMRKALPPSIHFLHNDTFDFHDVSIAGARLWDTKEYDFRHYIEMKDNPKASVNPQPVDLQKQEELFERELTRLKASLAKLNSQAKTRIAITHYPPIGADLSPSRASKLLEEHKINICVFGHLHSVRKDSLPFGTKNGIRYIFASCDYINCTPLRVL
jgi:predicted phosphohydrolase